MSNNIMNGLDLFKDPFCRLQPAYRQPRSYSQPSSSGIHTTNSHSKLTAQQSSSNHQTAIQPPVQPKPPTDPAHQLDPPVKSATQAKSSAPVQTPKQDSTKAPESVQSQKPKGTPAPVKSPAPVDSQKSETPKKELELDMSSSGTATVRKSSTTADDTAKRKAHEESEAKRKAEWEAKQAAKKQAEKAAFQKLQNMSDDDVIAESIKRVGTDVERLTRRNMKECVAAHIQELARKDPVFARRTMHPRKSMINCFKYINRKAKEYIRQEMKDNDTQPENGVYGGDVPDGLCYQWSEDYFNDPDALEDQEKEETFTPKPYVTKSPSKPSSKATKTQKKTEAKESRKEQEQKDYYKQMSLF